MTDTDAMNSIPSNPIPMREEDVNRFKELQEILYKFFKWLFGVIAFKTSPMGEALFIAHPIIMMTMVMMSVLYFSLWLMGTMLPKRTGIFQLILVVIMMLITSVSTVLVMSIISSFSLLAWLSVLLWIGVFALTAYSCYQMLYTFVFCAILDSINQFRNGTQSTRSRV